MACYSSNHSSRFPDSVEPYIQVLIISLLILGILTNSIILVALIRSNKLRKNAYVVLVLLLCISDIVLCVNTLGFIFFYLFKVKSGSVNRIECHVALHFFLSGIATSLGQTLLICINRLLASVEVAAANKFLFQRKRKYVSTTMVFFTVQMYFLIIFAFRGKGDEVDYCDFCALYKDGNYTVALALLNILYCGLYIVILVSYTFAMFFIKSRFQKVIPGQTVTTVSVINLHVNGDQNDELAGTQNVETPANMVYRSSSTRIDPRGPRFRLTRRAMKTLGILLLFLSIFTLPFITVCILISLHINVPMIIPFFAMAFVLISCISNPFLYTWRFQELRAELKKMFRWKRTSN